ncbi:DMT family transporter [Imbroritus primus]|uniref:DMT family transporter n=1 Tax=Imbroritus primus TaxID=3058603 RepID=A0ACD3SN46_9BURK|nr:DMT family transporter [Burkholderiaceae bacterium PBA]
MQSLWMLVAAFFFSLMGVCVKLASETYTTGEIIFFRCLIGVILIAWLMRRRGETLRTPHAISHIKRSVFGLTALMMMFYCLSQLPLATALTLNYMSPVWIALILSAGAVLAGKRGPDTDRRLVVAILLSFAGVICLLRPSVDSSQLAAGLIGLISGFFTALAYVEVRALGKLGESENRIVFYFSALGLVLGIVWMYFTGVSTHTWSGVALLLATGVTATIGQTTMTRAYKRGNTLLTANLQYAGIVFGVGLGILIWNDRLDWLSWSGMAMIIISGIATTLIRAREDARAAQAAAATPPEAEVHPEV